MKKMQKVIADFPIIDFLRTYMLQIFKTGEYRSSFQNVHESLSTIAPFDLLGYILETTTPICVILMPCSLFR